MASVLYPDFTTPLTEAVAGLGPALLGIGVVGIGIALGIFGLMKGWGLIKSLIDPVPDHYGGGYVDDDNYNDHLFEHDDYDDFVETDKSKW